MISDYVYVHCSHATVCLIKSTLLFLLSLYGLPVNGKETKYRILKRDVPLYDDNYTVLIFALDFKASPGMVHDAYLINNVCYAANTIK